MPWKDKWDKFKDGAKYQEISAHIEKNKNVYISAVASSAITAAVLLMLKQSSTSSPINVDAGRDAIVAGRDVVMENVKMISADRQGPPSWVIRNKMTNHVEKSQRRMALHDGVSQSTLSRHLNGLRDHANGMEYERLCLAG